MKEKTKNKQKRHSFARRLGWRILLVLFLSNVVIIGFVLLFVVFGTGLQSNINYNNMLSFTGDRLETILDDVEVTTKNIVGEVEEYIDHPEQIYDLLEQELKLTPHLRGCFVAFKPYYFPKKGRWYEPYVVRLDSASMERKQIGNSRHNYFEQEWYQKGMEAESGYWSDPYYDADGAHAMLCSFVMPIHNRQGQTVGVFGADFPLEWLTEMLQEMDRNENERYYKYNSNDRAYYDLEDVSYKEYKRRDSGGSEESESSENLEKTESSEDSEYSEYSEDDMDFYNVYSFIIGRAGHYIVSPKLKGFNGDNFLTDVNATPDTTDNELCRLMMSGERGRRTMKINDVTTHVYFAPLSHAGWSMAIAVPRFTLFFWGIVIGVLIVFFMILGMVAVFIVSQIAIHRATKPLRFLTESAEEVAKGHFNTPLPLFKPNDEISQLRDSFETMQHSLTKYVEELKATTTMKASMESELRIAHSIQMSMLPKTFPAFPDRTDIDLYGSVMPAKAVGGDLYDFYIRDEKLFFCIGDVSGKGVPASLVMAVTRSLFRNISAHTAKPDHIINALNSSLSEGNDTNMFVTLFVGVLDLPTGHLRYCNAGHDAPLLVGGSEVPVEPNLPVGVMPGMQFKGQETQIKSGTTIFLYTDGLTEAENASHQLFGMDRVKALLSAFDVRQVAPEVPKALITAMTAAVHQFVGDTEQSDDLTMLAVEYKQKKLEVKLERNLVLHNDVQEIPQLATFVDEICEALGFDMSTTMQMNLALEEAVVNVMNYAYPPDTSGEVRISAIANDERVKFVISDDGIPFDPTAKEEADITLSAEERNIGGLGIHLVRQIMDSINYERIGQQNVFTLRKKLHA